MVWPRVESITPVRFPYPAQARSPTGPAVPAGVNCSGLTGPGRCLTIWERPTRICQGRALRPTAAALRFGGWSETTRTSGCWTARAFVSNADSRRRRGYDHGTPAIRCLARRPISDQYRPGRGLDHADPELESAS